MYMRGRVDVALFVVLACSVTAIGPKKHAHQHPVGVPDRVSHQDVPIPDQSPKVIAATAAGRRDRMQPLVLHLHIHYAAGSIDSWQLWENTRNVEDELFLRDLAANHSSWISIVEFPSSCDKSLKGTNKGVTCFWRDAGVQQTMFANTILRLDDDTLATRH